ncbi:MAG: hypothetical protein NZ578_07255 [Candidatus Binatia bacterium]|nr:hypothetical protein [Candidatus Binatia bacterium]
MNTPLLSSIRRCLRIAGVLGSLLFFCGISTSSSAADEPKTLTFQNGRLSAHLSATPIRQVMEHLGSLTGARVLWLHQAEDTPVSVDFTDLPLADALRRILGGRNFMLFYRSSGQETWLSEIWISAPSGGQGQAVSPLPPTPPAQIPAQLMQTALYGQDTAARLNAINRMKKFARTDPRVQSILSQLSRNAIEPEVRAAAEQALAEIGAGQ